MGEESLARILRKVINYEQLARAADLVDIRNEINRHDDASLGIDAKIEAVEKRVDAKDNAPKRTSTGSRTTSSASTSSQEPSSWQPRLIHCRGCAPYGCGPGYQQRKQELAEVQEKVLALADGTLRAALTPSGALNHNVTLRCDSEYDTRDKCNRLDKVLFRKQFKVHGKDLRATVESPPAKKRACARYFRFVEDFRAMRTQGKDFAVCSRSLQVFHLPS